MRFNNCGAFVVKGTGTMLLAGALTACTIHPPGERAEVESAVKAGGAYTQAYEKRTIVPLAENASPEELVTYAMLTNAELEGKYWKWRAALEQVPQAGTQKSGLELSFNTMITDGRSALEDTTLAIGNDAMNSLVLPSKLRTEATMALHEAQAAGRRFDKARFELRNKVLAAYYDYALTAELMRLETANKGVLEFMVKASESRVANGAASQTELLKAANEVELSASQFHTLHCTLDHQRAVINALLDRPTDAALEVPGALPAPRALAQDNTEVLALVAAENPELQALGREISGRGDAIARAKLEYVPDFNVGFSSDLAGVTQSLMGSVVLPYLRYQAIDAGIRQAQDNLHAAQAMQRQTSRELAARAYTDLTMLRDDERVAELYEKSLIPRAERIITASQNTFASGNGLLIDLLETQRSVIALRRMLAELRMDREKQLADLEELAGASLGGAAGR